jgi:transposase-like protein
VGRIYPSITSRSGVGSSAMRRVLNRRIRRELPVPIGPGVDETYVKVAGGWAYLYRPRVINVDGHPAYASAVDELASLADTAVAERPRI